MCVFYFVSSLGTLLHKHFYTQWANDQRGRPAWRQRDGRGAGHCRGREAAGAGPEAKEGMSYPPGSERVEWRRLFPLPFWKWKSFNAIVNIFIIKS